MAKKKASSAARSMKETPVRKWPTLEVFTEGASARAQKLVENTYGKAFAIKASERLCHALAAVHSFGAESAVTAPRPTILECNPAQASEAEVMGRAAMLGAASTRIPQRLLLLARRHGARQEVGGASV